MTAILYNMVHYSNILTPTLNPAPAVSTTATFLTFVQGDKIFRGSVAGGVGIAASKSVFAANSNIIIQAARVSIPNLPGARISLAPGTTPYDPPGDNSLVIQAVGTAGSGTYATFIPQLDQFFDWQALVAIQADNTAFQLMTPANTEVGIDTRNLQTVYTTTPIDLYLKIELLVLSPYALVS